MGGLARCSICNERPKTVYRHQLSKLNDVFIVAIKNQQQSLTDAKSSSKVIGNPEELQNWVDDWIACKPISFFRYGVAMLPERLEKVVENVAPLFPNK